MQPSRRGQRAASVPLDGRRGTDGRGGIQRKPSLPSLSAPHCTHSSAAASTSLLTLEKISEEERRRCPGDQARMQQDGYPSPTDYGSRKSVPRARAQSHTDRPTNAHIWSQRPRSRSCGAGAHTSITEKHFASSDVGLICETDIFQRGIQGPTGPFIRKCSNTTTRSESGQDDQNASLAVAVALSRRSPSPPRQRMLRERKAAQLAPYTTEMQRYQRRLIRNDWQDAVVISRQFARAGAIRRREGEPSNESAEHVEEHTTGVVQDTANKRIVQKTAKARPSSNEASANMQRTGVKNDEEHRQQLHSSSLSRDEDDHIGDKALSTMAHDATPHSSLEHVFAEHPRKRQRILSDSEESDMDLDPLSTISSSLHPSQTTIEVATDAEGSEKDDIDENSRLPAVGPAEKARDYEKLLRTLKRTMPARMAREYIEDLKAMDREWVETDEQVQHGSEGPVRNQNALDTGPVQPGETRRRVAPTSEREGRDLALVGDSESDEERLSISSLQTSSDEERAEPSLSEEIRHHRPWRVHERVDIGRKEESRDILVPFRRSTSRKADGDDIDRMLSKGDSRPSRRVAQMRNKDVNTKKALPIPASKFKDLTNLSVRKRSSGAAGLSISTSLSYLREARLTKEQQSHQKSDFSRESSLFESLTDLQKELSRLPTKLKEGPRTENPSKPRSTPHQVRSPKSMSSPGKASSSFNKVYLGGHSSNLPNVLPSPSTTPHLLLSPAHQKMQSTASGRVSSQANQHRTPAHIRDQVEDLQTWQFVGSLRVTFGIKATSFGMRCDPDGYVGKGHLFELLHPQALSHAHLQEDAADHVERLLQPRSEELLHQMKATLENWREDSDTEGSQIDVAGLREDLRQLERLTVLDVKANKGTEALMTVLDDLIKDLRLANHTMQETAFFDLLSGLQWLKIVYLWRALHRDCLHTSAVGIDDAVDGIEASFLQSCQELVLTLLLYGLHKPMIAIRKAEEELNAQNEQSSVINLKETSVEMWVRVINLLCCKACQQIFQTRYALFWDILESAMERYQSVLRHTKSALIVAENTWYSIFAINALGCFSASSGSFTTQACLSKPFWPLVLRSMSLVRLRYDDQVEGAVNSAALHGRDEYIRVIMHRIMHLNQTWNWTMEGVEPILTRLYALFDPHRLEDLPSETTHDFPHFLYLSDEQQDREWTGKSGGDTAFGLFLRILSLSADHAKQAEPTSSQHAERAASRVLSRFTPVRTMSFSKTNVPTSLERSALYNHYSLALLHLKLVPSSQPQRLLQIQQYLKVGKADHKSQIIAIRAMMYAMMILRELGHDVNPVIGWFKYIVSNLLAQLDDLQRHGSCERTNAFRWQAEVRNCRTLITAALRASRHAMQIDRENDGSDGPVHTCSDASLLASLWDARFLEAPFAKRNPTLTLEALLFLQPFLSKFQTSLKSASQDRNSSSHMEESQDSCGDLFDDIDFNDIDLLNAAGYENNLQPGSLPLARSINVMETSNAIGKLLHDHISPALFKLIAGIAQGDYAIMFGFKRPDGPLKDSRLANIFTKDGFRTPEHQVDTLLERSSQFSIGPLTLKCWLLCTRILVEGTQTRSWDYYFRHGPEDPKSFGDQETRALLFAEFMTSVLGQPPGSGSIWTDRDAYGANLREIWTTVLCNLSLQSPPRNLASLFTHIHRHENRRINALSQNAGKTLFDNTIVAMGTTAEIDTDLRKYEGRIEILKTVLANSASVAISDSRFVPVTICAVSGMLSVLRRQLHQSDDRARQASPVSQGANRFAKETTTGCIIDTLDRVITMCKTIFSAPILQGLALDMRKSEEELRRALPTSISTSKQDGWNSTMTS